MRRCSRFRIYNTNNKHPTEPELQVYLAESDKEFIWQDMAGNIFIAIVVISTLQIREIGKFWRIELVIHNCFFVEANYVIYVIIILYAKV
jgi:magnesium-transporting ATPase (P-type)